MYHWTVDVNGAPVGDHRIAVAVGQEVYSIGRFVNVNESMMVDMQVFHTASLRWTKLPPVSTARGALDPTLRYFHDTAVFIGDLVYISGFFSNSKTIIFTLYAFNVESHRLFRPEVSGNGPEVTRCKRASACVLGQVMYVWLSGGNTNEICRLDTNTMVWSLINARGSPPPPNYMRTSANIANIIGTKIFVVGTGDRLGYYMKVFDIETNCWLSSPCAASFEPSFTDSDTYECIAYECVVACNGELYMLVRRYPHYLTKELWKCNPVTFSWKRIQPKGKVPCTSFRMCCCVMGDRIVVSGGDAKFQCASRLHILDKDTSLKTLCKLSVIHYGLEQSELPHNIRWELAAMKTKEEEGED